MAKSLDEQPWVIAAAAAAAAAVIKLNGLTLRWEVEGWDHLAGADPALLCFWHNRLLYIGYQVSRVPVTMLVSQSKDGAYIAAVAAWYGIEAVRGSSTRGGARALVEMVSLARRSSRHLGITPDGPKGPLYEVKSGIIALARKTGRPLIPVTLSATRVHRFASWDRFMVPLPFARVRVVFGAPMAIDPAPDAFEGERLRVQATLRRMTVEVDRACGQPVDPELEVTL